MGWTEAAWRSHGCLHHGMPDPSTMPKIRESKIGIRRVGPAQGKAANCLPGNRLKEKDASGKTPFLTLPMLHAGAPAMEEKWLRAQTGRNINTVSTSADRHLRKPPMIRNNSRWQAFESKVEPFRRRRLDFARHNESNGLCDQTRTPSNGSLFDIMTWATYLIYM